MYTLKEVAVAAGMKPGTLRREITYGLLTTYKVFGSSANMLTYAEITRRFDAAVLSLVLQNRIDGGKRQSKRDWRLPRGGRHGNHKSKHQRGAARKSPPEVKVDNQTEYRPARIKKEVEDERA